VFNNFPLIVTGRKDDVSKVVNNGGL